MILAPNETWIDLAFPLRGETLPLDHGYALFAASSRVVPALHQGEGSPA